MRRRCGSTPAGRRWLPTLSTAAPPVAEQKRPRTCARIWCEAAPARAAQDASARTGRTTSLAARLPTTQRGDTVQERRLLSDLRQTKTTPKRGFPLIGETGFEPATARPPAGCA